MWNTILRLKPLVLSLAGMFLQTNLYGISLIAPHAVFIVCMGLISLVVVAIGITNKFISPSLWCLLWFLTTIKEQLIDTTQKKTLIIFLLVLCLITIFSLGIEVAVFRERLRKNLANSSTTEEHQNSNGQV